MITVLLWGERWWLPHQTIPVPFVDSSQAADQLAAAWPEKSRTLRIIYHPDDFVTAAVDCPNGNRATLTMALAEEHPVLMHPGHVWSHEPILAAGDVFNTLLHYETKPGLFALVQQLQEYGFTVVSAWPLPTWLNALPPELSDSGAMSIVALSADRFCVYRHSSDGVRSVQTGQGPDVVSAVAAYLQPAAAPATTEFVLYVTTDDGLVERLNERVPLASNQIIGIFSVTEALAKPAALPVKHPAQLLPPVPKITPRRAAIAASAVLLGVTALCAASYVRDYVALEAGRAARETQKETLRGEVAHLRANAAEISALRSQIAAAQPSPSGAALLQQLSASIPPEVILDSVHMTNRDCTIEGWSAPTAAAADGDRWLRQLGDPDAWTLVTSPESGGRFQLRRKLSP